VIAVGASEKKGSTMGIRTSVPPLVHFFSGRSESFVQFGGGWRRMTPEDEARARTGYHPITGVSSVGVSVVRRPNGLVRVAFDLMRLDLNLHPSAIEHLQSRWKNEAAKFSKSLQRSTSRCAHFSKSFASFEIAPESIEEWKGELEAALSNLDSYELLPTHV
jgi:hypothetical protein